MIIVDLSTNSDGEFMKAIINKLVKTENSTAAMITRIALGLAILPHGLQKTFGLFGGYGLEGTLGFFTGTLGVPWLVALLVILGESLGALSLIVGFMTRFSAASLILIMLGAVQMVHFNNGFFMNWYGNQAGEGFEYHILVIAMALSLVFSGAGRFSIDKKLSK